MNRNSSDYGSPFAGLPAGFARELLGRSAQVADELAVPFREITAGREAFRRTLREKNLLGQVQVLKQAGQNNVLSLQNEKPLSVRGELVEPQKSLPSVCGISWFSSREQASSPRFVLAAAFGVEGLLSNGAGGTWDIPQHRLFYSAENQSVKPSPVLNALSAQFAAELANGAAHDIVLANDSWTAPFVSVMGNLKTAMEEKDTPAGKEFIRRLKPTLAAFSKFYDQAATRWVGMPRNSAKRELMAELNASPGYDDMVFFTLVLDEGEFAGPAMAETGEIEAAAKLPIKEESFSASRDSMVNAIRKTRVLYFRPYRWTPAMRVEISRPTAENTESLNRLLAGIQFQCRTPGMSQPYPLARAESMIRDLAGGLPALRQALIAQMTKTGREPMGDMFPLLMQ